MRVAVVCGFAGQWWGNDITPNVLEAEKGPTVAGGEEAAIRAAVGLKELGHHTELWWYGKRGEWRGVPFHDLYDDLYGKLQREHWDAVVSFSSLRPLEWAMPGTTRLFAQQLNDLFEQGHWDKVDCIVSPSASHAQQLHGWGWRKRPYAVVHNGLDAELYGKHISCGSVHPQFDEYHYEGHGVHVPDWRSRPLDVGYWSSPDRGLHHLLRAWPEVLKQVPDAKLHVFYEIDRFVHLARISPSALGDRARLLERQVAKAKADPSIVFHGAVTRHQLRKIQFQCRVMAYPYVPVHGFCEGFCGSVNQGIAAGCHVLTTPQDALPTLYAGAVTWLPTEPEKLDEALAPAVIRALTDAEWSLDRVKQAEPHRFEYTWERAALEMEAACLKKNWQVREYA